MRKSIAKQTEELATAVPTVVSHRLQRMLSAGLQPSTEDILELNQMYWEKALAANQSCNDIALEALRFQTKFLGSMIPYWSSPWKMPEAAMQAAIELGPAAASRTLHKAMAPIHDTTMKNAQRISEIVHLK